MSLIVYGNLNSICILLLCENYINLNYVEFGSQWFSGLLYPSTFLYIHSINI